MSFAVWHNTIIKNFNKRMGKTMKKLVIVAIFTLGLVFGFSTTFEYSNDVSTQGLPFIHGS
jgi:hypothetical protein